MENKNDDIELRVASLERRMSNLKVTCIILAILILSILLPSVQLVLGVLMFPVLVLFFIVVPVILYIYGVQRMLNRFFGSAQTADDKFPRSAGKDNR